MKNRILIDVDSSRPDAVKVLHDGLHERPTNPKQWQEAAWRDVETLVLGLSAVASSAVRSGYLPASITETILEGVREGMASKKLYDVPEAPAP